MRISEPQPDDDFSFPKSARLLENADFRRVTAAGRKLSGRFFLFFALQTTETEGRIGLTVSRKVGNAVKRNQVKRHLREFFRLNRHTLFAGQAWVAIARPLAGSASAAALRQDLQKLFRSYVNVNVPLNKPPSVGMSECLQANRALEHS